MEENCIVWLHQLPVLASSTWDSLKKKKKSGFPNSFHKSSN